MSQVQTVEKSSATPSLPANGKANPGREVAAQLEQMKAQFTAALPAHIAADKFQRVVMTAININPALLACDRRSLFNACNRAAQDGLLPDGREGALVPFGNQVTWLPMVWGLVKKIRQSGELSTITAQIVYEKDFFNYVLGDEEKIEHRPMLTGDRGKPVLAYAIAKLKDGGIQREVMTYGDIEKARNVSRAKNSPMWKDWWTEAARKTVLRRLCKFLPLSAEDRRTLDRDETEFEAQKRDAKDLLQQAASQISAPAPAITHQAEADDDGVLDGEVTAAGPILGTLDVDAQQRAAEAEEVVSEGDAKERAAAVALRDRLRDAFNEMPDLEQLEALEESTIMDREGLPPDLRKTVETTVATRRKALKK